MQEFGVDVKNQRIQFMDPFGFFDFVHLERNAFCVLSDSGTVQEECSIFRIPNVTLRDVTERPETIECGSNILSGADVDTVMACVDQAAMRTPDWNPPQEYLATNVTRTVSNLLMGYHHG
jgi:UDP-N-acetylglucosamine 2-epimerase (non-hydrolysing)